MDKLLWPLLLALGACAPAVRPVAVTPAPAVAGGCSLAVQAVLDGDLGSVLSARLLRDLPERGLRVWKSTDFPGAWPTPLVLTGQADLLTTPDDRAVRPYRIGQANLRVMDRASGETRLTLPSPAALTGTPHPEVADYLDALEGALASSLCAVP